MKCELLSASAAEIYESCPLRYHARYELKKRSASGVEQEAGSLAHKVLERYYNPSNPAASFEEAFAAASKLEQCTDRKAFDEAKQMSSDYIRSHPRDSLAVIGTEIGFKFYLESGAGSLGFIDRLDLEADGSIVLVDYKSGNFVPTKAELEESHQTLLYALWAYLNRDFEGIESVRFAYEYIRTGQTKTLQISRDQAMSYMEYFDHLFHAIVRNKKPLPRLNRFCWNCEHRGECPEYLNLIAVAKATGSILERPLETYRSASFNELVVAYDRLGTAAAIMDKEKRYIGDQLTYNLKCSGMNGAVVKQDHVARRVSLQSKRSTSWKPTVGRDFIKKHDLVDAALATVSPAVMEKLVKGNAEAKREMQDIISIEEGMPYPSVRKVKDKEEHNGE